MTTATAVSAYSHTTAVHALNFVRFELEVLGRKDLAAAIEYASLGAIQTLPPDSDYFAPLARTLDEECAKSSALEAKAMREVFAYMADIYATG